MDYRKLIKAGFRIFRKEKANRSIKELSQATDTDAKSHGWNIFNKYKTIKAMEEAFAELMKDDKKIEG